jgi:hypothetical protein
MPPSLRGFHFQQMVAHVFNTRCSLPTHFGSADYSGSINSLYQHHYGDLWGAALRVIRCDPEIERPNTKPHGFLIARFDVFPQHNQRQKTNIHKERWVVEEMDGKPIREHHKPGNKVPWRTEALCHPGLAQQLVTLQMLKGKR